METLKIPRVKLLNEKEIHIVRAYLDNEAYDKLNKLSLESNIGLSQLAGKLVGFALENTEIVDV